MESKQLAFWNKDGLPAQFDRVRRAEEGNRLLLSVVDAIEVLTETANSRRYWSDLKRKLQREGSDVYEKIVHVKMPDTMGRLQETDMVSVEDMMRIIQSVPSPRAEPFKLWMARLAEERIEEERNPSQAIANGLSKIERAALRLGHDLTWVPDRILSTEARNYLMALLDAHWTGDRQLFIRTTDLTYQGVFGGDTRYVRRRLGLEKKSQKTRDHMSALSLAFIRQAELICGRKLEDADYITRDEFLRFVAVVADMIGGQARQTEQLLGIDVLTGHKLLGPADAIRGQ